MRQSVLVLEGHDGAGKTTLSMRLAEAVGGAHVRPFAGPQGGQMLKAAERGDVDRAAQLARRLVDQALAEHSAPVLICDRHWMTVFTLLPEVLWDSWLPLPPTSLCWAGIDVTLARLGQRGQEAQPSRSYHIHYLRRYWDLGRRFGCHVLRTDLLSEEACLEQLVAWAWPLLEPGISSH